MKLPIVEPGARALMAVAAVTLVAFASPVESLRVAPAVETVAMPAPELAASCGPDGWSHLESSVGESYSPWFDTAKGLDFQRAIKFRALGGETARQCATGRIASFGGADAYKVRSCLKPTACQVTGWIIVNNRTVGPGAGHRYPDLAAGWDIYYKIFRTWKPGSGSAND